jgi:rare lipoprotein A
MKKIFLVFIALFVTVFVPFYVQAQSGAGADIFRQEGIASWYGVEFEGRPTASGEIYDSSQLTAAHPTLPFGTRLVVTNLHNNKSVTVRVNDRGPFVAARIIDVSRAAAEQLDMIVTGTAPVLVESFERIVMPPPVQAPPVVQTQPIAQAPPVIQTQPVIQTSPPVTQTPPVVQAIPATTVYTSQPVVVAPVHARLTPEINIKPEKTYRLQIGSFRVARNAVEVFERCKSSGLNPAYERHMSNDNVEFFRVVIAGVPGYEVPVVAEKLGAAGFREALIREEN